ncbi:MAG: DUF927 domain-containing protein [Clostridia bacterium]|nr:DUF927 domain-containing protein [Clostridia bacterium]
MKINVNQYKALDGMINGFTPIHLMDEEYELYSDIASNGFIQTKKWIVYLCEKKVKDNVTHYLFPIARYISIRASQQDISTSERKYKIEFFDGEKKIITSANSSILCSSGVKELLSKGFIYDENNLKYLLTYLSSSACNSPIENVHSTLGWRFDEEEPIFLGSECVSKLDIQSQYVGNLDIQKHGLREEYFKMIKSEVLVGNPALEFAFVLGHCSPILGYINHYRDLGCLVFNFGNESSRGKSTAVELIVSPFGNPSVGKALLSTLDGTEQSLVTFASTADSHPVVFDEVGTIGAKNLRKLLYQLASGKERSRNTKEGKNKEAKTFNSVICTTAETQIIDETAPEGLRCRVFEITSDITPAITTSAANADRIKKCVYCNYGHTGIEFVNFVVANKLDMILEDYDNCYNSLLDLYKTNSLAFGKLSKRILSKLSVVLLTAKYLQECFHDISIDLKAIVNFIVDLERSVADERDIGDKALDYISQYIATHKNCFILDGETSASKIEGRIQKINMGKEVAILKCIVEKILSENGFENPKMIYKDGSGKRS